MFSLQSHKQCSFVVLIEELHRQYLVADIRGPILVSSLNGMELLRFGTFTSVWTSYDTLFTLPGPAPLPPIHLLPITRLQCSCTWARPFGHEMLDSTWSSACSCGTVAPLAGSVCYSHGCTYGFSGPPPLPFRWFIILILTVSTLIRHVSCTDCSMESC